MQFNQLNTFAFWNDEIHRYEIRSLANQLMENSQHCISCFVRTNAHMHRQKPFAELFFDDLHKTPRFTILDFIKTYFTAFGQN